MIQSYIYLPSFVNVLCAATVIWSGFVRFGEYIYLVYIATVYLCLRIHYITSFCILCIPTYFSLYLCVYIFRESFLQESYIPHISLKEQQRVVSIEHSLYYTQAFSRSISNYMSNFRKLYFDRKSTTEKQPSRCIVPWNVNI